MLNLVAVYMMVAASTGALVAADLADLPVGTRVRVVLRSEGPGQPRTLRGRITGSERDVFTLKPDGEDGAVVLRSDQVARLDRLLKSGKSMKGAAIGASVVGGAMLGLFAWYCTTDWGCEGADHGRVAALVGGAAAVGALIGAGTGPGDRWIEVGSGRSSRVAGGRPRVSLMPTKGGVAGRVAIRLPSRDGR